MGFENLFGGSDSESTIMSSSSAVVSLKDAAPIPEPIILVLFASGAALIGRRV